MVVRPRSGTPKCATPIVAFVVLVAIFCTGLGVGQLPGLPNLAGRILAQGGDGNSLSRSPPSLLAIPSIGIHAPVVEVTTAPDGSIDIPTGDPAKQTGWYAPGPTPGEHGIAVIVGHVDTATGPAVFADLPKLRRGRLVEVRRLDNKVATFSVDSVETFAKANFPAQRIFQEGGPARLALVTCGGSWVGGALGYADNVIVFATLR